MSLIFKKCIEWEDKRKICTAEENGKKYKLENNSRFVIRKVKVDKDKCMPQKQGEKRCDYLISIDNQDIDKVFFIELKGGRLLDAVEQIFDTIIYLKQELNGYELNARIIGSRSVPAIHSEPKYKKLFELVHPKGTIRIATNKFLSETI